MTIWVRPIFLEFSVYSVVMQQTSRAIFSSVIFLSIILIYAMGPLQFLYYRFIFARSLLQKYEIFRNKIVLERIIKPKVHT